MFCKSCGKETPEKAIACLGCGMSPKHGAEHCSACGAETKKNQIICTSCGVQINTSFLGQWPPFLQRFFISFSWALGLFIIIILTTQSKSHWGVGVIGSLMFALLSGVIAMVIRAKYKTLYVSVSVLVCCILAFIIGYSE